MDPDYSFLFHQSSKNYSRGHQPWPANDADWPDEWKTVYYKSYARLPKIELSEKKMTSDLFSLLRNRASRRDFTKGLLTLDELSLLLKYSCGTHQIGKTGQFMTRAQPSGGARFPLEVYPIVLRGEGDLKSGIYHYNVKEHALDVLHLRTFTDQEVGELFSYEWAQSASVVFVITAVFHRNQIKYGERGYRYILIEAGHVGQNMYLVSEALGIKCCGFGGTRDEKVERLLQVDGIQESVVYALVVGR